MSRKYQSSRDVPTEVLVKRLEELSDAICGGRRSFDYEFTMRVPAECDRDADLVLAEAARRLSEIAKVIAYGEGYLAICPHDYAVEYMVGRLRQIKTEGD